MKRILLTSFIGILGLCAHALTVETIIIQHSYCGRPSGAAYANATGGTPPYTYSWDIPSTEANVHGLSPGIYTVTVTDAVFDQATAQAEILLLNNYWSVLGPGLPLSYCAGDPCQFAIYTGQDAVTEVYDPTGAYGPWPYSFSHPNLVDYGQSTTCMSSVMPYPRALATPAAALTSVNTPLPLLR